ncbi:MAG: ComF family protein [Clostridia bacterium]|nr:ComF family protein [Clostridia bacterium]
MNKDLKLKLWHIFFPKRCACCDVIIRYDLLFCKECEEKFEVAKTSERCKVCFNYKKYCNCEKKPKFFFRSASRFVYKPPLSSAIIELKRRKNPELARFFAKEMLKTIKKRFKNVQFDAIIPVPLHKSRIKQRGFNQSELLCDELSKELHIPVIRNTLVQEKLAQSQHTLKFSERAKNVKGIYKTGHIPIEIQRVLLVDDIMTSGSTLNECAKVLRIEGVTKIYCISIAKTD